MRVYCTHASLSVQHLKEQYEALRPVLDALVRAYPPHIKPEYVTYESYLWAVELWYAYAIQVGSTDHQPAVQRQYSAARQYSTVQYSTSVRPRSTGIMGSLVVPWGTL